MEPKVSTRPGRLAAPDVQGVPCPGDDRHHPSPRHIRLRASTRQGGRRVRVDRPRGIRAGHGHGDDCGQGQARFPDARRRAGVRRPPGFRCPQGRRRHRERGWSLLHRPWSPAVALVSAVRRGAATPRGRPVDRRSSLRRAGGLALVAPGPLVRGQRLRRLLDCGVHSLRNDADVHLGPGRRLLPRPRPVRS